MGRITAAAQSRPTGIVVRPLLMEVRLTQHCSVLVVLLHVGVCAAAREVAEARMASARTAMLDMLRVGALS